MKILITSGATREPIDEVRYITNFSTGNTGAFLADFLSENGHEITFLAGLGSTRPGASREIIEYTSFADLDAKLKEKLSRNAFDAVIHLAAVSDYSIHEIETESGLLNKSTLKKIDSSGDLTLRLRRNHKIVSRLKTYAQASGPLVIAFKLTNSVSFNEQMAAITKLSLDPGVDFVVHNDFHDIAARKPNRFRIFKNENVIRESLDRRDLANELENLIRSPK